MKTTIARRRAGLAKRVRAIREHPRRIDRPTPSKPLSTLLDAYGPDGPAPDILHLGGSESEQVSFDDWSKKTLSRMISERMAPRTTCHITNTAYNSEVYVAILRALAAMPQRPRVILVHAVVRMGSPIWDHNPSWRFEEDIAALEAFAVDPTVGVPLVQPYASWLYPMREARDPAAWERYLSTPVAYPGRPERTIGECLAAIHASEGEERRRLGYRFNFLYEMDDDHRRLVATRDMFAELDRLGCAYVCFLHPHNYETGRALLGAEWDESTRRKREQIVRACGPTARLHDWIELLPATGYYDSVEHWNESGRPVIVDALEDAIDAAVPEWGVSSSRSRNSRTRVRQRELSP